MKIRKLVVLPALAAGTITATALLGAGPASAGTGNPADCPVPTVSAVLATPLSDSGATVTISGTGFGCHDAAGQAVPVKITFYNGPLANPNNLWSTSATAKNGIFGITEHLPASAVSADSATSVLAQTTAGTDLSGVGSLSTGSAGAVSVPAGHVDVSPGGQPEIALILGGLAGAALIGAGVTLAARRRTV